jgi:hypothetical protein
VIDKMVFGISALAALKKQTPAVGRGLYELI